MDYMKDLLEKLNKRNATIGIIGIGYVGLPLLIRYASVGYKVMGFDIDQSKINYIEVGRSYIDHIPDEKIKKSTDAGAEITTDFSRIAEVDGIILCVPTPLNKYREPDLSFIKNTMETIRPYLKKGQVLSLESTTYPGTTEEELLPIIESQDMQVGKDFFLVYSPEREDPGNKNYSTETIPKVVGGHTSNCLQIGVSLYKDAINKIVPVSSTKAAEMTKLLENIHRAVNIGLVNEMKIVADRMGIDIHEVIDAAATKPFGFTPYYPGPGLGGHCIPIDPFYLTWKAREYGLNTRFIELSGEVNNRMPDYVLEKTQTALNHHYKSIRGSKILILGVAYKKNVADMRETPAAMIIEKLMYKGAKVDYSDPHVPEFPVMRKYSFDMQSVELTEGNLKSYDGVVLVTDHDSFDYDFIYKHAKFIVDSRGRFRNPCEKVIKS